ncbi:bifunctional diguanylate cyclase/phosphodiesterase [Quadrisphaera sp. INWT6]|uniref:putative bifunctional diguanylate cyclase/phosphodiesterase n=1 Tax=Quadrisphaera sp. INWT6 TaxID=2596917 RepID=UPI0018924005|nr:bifunctional diguanylate cyclase/phosphodiesterase [Quadrisphaera sp. INWT6]MBF5081132.1 bifunctional diguanylate cyclase/phosphodiesterase [Quadrisphaera sp. INWT6]
MLEVARGLTASGVVPVWGGLLLAAALGVLLVLLRRQHRRHSAAVRTDPLTGLGNRVRLAEVGDRVLAGVSELDGDGHHGPGLLLLDLDGFKDVNDTLGHAAGDALLAQVAGRLAEAAPPGAVVTRLGGDEFAVLLTVPVTSAQAVLHGKRLLAALGAGGFSADGVDLDITSSVGAAVAPTAGRTVGDLLRHADLAMYEAKRSRAGVLPYTADLAPDSTDGLTTLALLRQAMEEGQLTLRYQPVVDAATLELRGFEALLRWQHPTRGLLLPAEFLPLAERTTLVRPLTRWVVLTALRQGAAWRRAGLDTSIAVNVSASVLEPGLLGIVDEALARSAWPAEQLVLEITETAVSNDVGEALEVVRALADRGVRVSVDDFGAGYTSLGQLRGLAVRQLKVDRQFVTDLVGVPEDEAIAASIIDLGHRLGLQVVAEGVEDAAVAERLRELGCDELQGYWVGRPVTPELALARWVVGADAHGAVEDLSPGATRG